MTRRIEGIRTRGLPQSRKHPQSIMGECSKGSLFIPWPDGMTESQAHRAVADKLASTFSLAGPETRWVSAAMPPRGHLREGVTEWAHLPLPPAPHNGQRFE